MRRRHVRSEQSISEQSMCAAGGRPLVSHTRAIAYDALRVGDACWFGGARRAGSRRNRAAHARARGGRALCCASGALAPLICPRSRACSGEKEGGGRGSVGVAGTVDRFRAELGVVPRGCRAQRLSCALHGGVHVVIVDRDPCCCEGFEPELLCPRVRGVEYGALQLHPPGLGVGARAVLRRQQGVRTHNFDGRIMCHVNRARVGCDGNARVERARGLRRPPQHHHDLLRRRSRR
eukprot:6198549-Pleurochrysis_carterae.AAC.6